MDPSSHLGPRLRHLNLLLRANMDRKFTSLDLTGTQSFILRHLSACGQEAVYPKDIEKRFNLTHPTVSGILQRMEAKGFITITPDPDDRRCKMLHTTEKADRCQKEVCSYIGQLETVMMDGMTETEKDTFLRCLDRVISNLEQISQKEDATL